MQQPTCIKTRIRSTTDAHVVFRAVQLGILPMVKRRLDAEERLALCSGSVYVWEERGPNTEITGLGIERFTEGKRWSQSRVRDVSDRDLPALIPRSRSGVGRNSSSTSKDTCLPQMSSSAQAGVSRAHSSVENEPYLTSDQLQ